MRNYFRKDGVMPEFEDAVAVALINAACRIATEPLEALTEAASGIDKETREAARAMLRDWFNQRDDGAALNESEEHDDEELT